MKRITCLLAALLLICGLTWAQTDVLNHDVIGVPSTTYVTWSDLTLTSGAVYAGNTAGGNQAIQLRTNNNNSGIVTTTSAGSVTNITVTWNESTNASRSLDIYGSNTAYEAAADLYGDNAGTLIGSIAFGDTELEITDEYAFIGIRSNNGALWLDEIQITWGEGSGVTPPSITASNVAVAYNATEGAIEYTINNPVEGGVLSATTEAEWLTIGTVGGTVPFTCTVNDDAERSATVTLTYTYNTDQTATKHVTVTQAGNPNGPGSEANPYTVAQARAAIDAGTGTQGVYATGIVSAIPTAYNSNYGNVTFNMVDEEGDEVFLQAYRCGGDEAAEVTIGDVVVVYGNLTKYNTTYEFAQGCQVVSLTHPTITDPVINVNPVTVNATAEGGEGTLMVTYLNVSETEAEVYFCNADGMPATYDWIEAEIDDEYNVAYTIDANEGEARTAYLMVVVGEIASSLVTINQAAYVAPALDYAELPFEFNGVRADIEGTDGLSQEGLGTDYNATSNPTTKLKFDGTGDWLLLHFLEAPGTLLFDIKGNSFNGGTFTVQTSEDGETYEDLASYTELGAAETKTFSNLDENVRYIKWIYTEKSQGNVGLGNIYLYEYGDGPTPEASITVTPATVNEDANEHDGTLALAYENLEISDMTDFGVQFYDAEGEEAGEPEWVEVVVAEQDPTIGEGYVVSYFMVENQGEARTAYLKVFVGDVYSNLVTINQAEYVAPVPTTTYTLATAIESGRHYIITNGLDKAMGGQNNNNRAAAEITTENGVASVSNANVFEFVINGPDVDGFYTIYDATIPGYLYGAGASSSNYLRTQTFCDNRGQWTISFDEETNAASIVANFEGRNTMRYNSNNDIFSCYVNGGQQDIFLYVKDDDTNYEFYTDIQGYGEGNGNWYLIATPVNNINPTEVNNMLGENGYDLYMFDQTAVGAEWRNYKTTNFMLNAGQGYLYANQDNVTLKFEGAPSTVETVNLTYDANSVMKGWNLIGNPFGTAASIDIADFYIMNEDGTDFIVAERDLINPMEGIFVQANAAGETVTFNNDLSGYWTGEVPGNPVPEDDCKLDLRVNGSNGGSDFARIRCGEGIGLEKFMLNENHTKIYFPMADNDYAVVYADNMGEIPVNFKAAADGTYTLSVNSENMDMNYLHLIDNMTGMDVDLLVNPIYSFEATVNDNAARFTLVFADLTGIEENNANEFAFFSNGNLIVSNEGNATLQVVDLKGSIVKAETISGNCSIVMNAAPGIYMVRLVTGDNVKVQKVVVK